MNSGGRRPRGHEGQGTATACPQRAAAGRGLEGPRRRLGAAKSRLDDASTLERILRTAVTAKCVSATSGTLEGTRTAVTAKCVAPGTLEGRPKYPGKGMSGALERQSTLEGKSSSAPGTLESEFPSTLEQKSQVPWKAIPKCMHFIGK